jgi:hypothetical protein
METALITPDYRKNKHTYLPTMFDFRRKHENFFRKHFPEIFVDERIQVSGDVVIRLSKIDHTELYLVPLAKDDLVTDMHFACRIIYKECDELDRSTGVWKKSTIDAMPTSRFLKAIFRNIVAYPADRLIEELKKRKIQLLCLREYFGDISLQQLSERFKKEGLYLISLR